MAILLAALAIAWPAATARAQAAEVSLSAGRAVTGYVALSLASASGGTVQVSELRGASRLPLTTLSLPAGGHAELARAAAWRCSLRQRTFVVDLTGPDGARASATATVRTPSCAHRFALAAVPARPLAGRAVQLRLRDRWTLGGLRARACVSGPGRLRCRHVALGAATAHWRWRPPRPGTWRLRVRVAGVTLERTVAARPRGGHLRLVAAGDSMIQLVDGDLRRRLAHDRVDVRFDDHISTGITKPFMLDWVRHARHDARAHRPDVTVMFLGANDGYPIGRAQCCAGAWVKAYAARAARIMRAYARGGRGRVYWLLLPAPREPTFQKVFAGVNAALRLAAAAYPDTVRLVDLGATFTPDGRFRPAIRWHGRTVTVRQGDGVHLNVTGADIAATLVIRAMRRDGVV